MTTLGRMGMHSHVSYTLAAHSCIRAHKDSLFSKTVERLVSTLQYNTFDLAPEHFLTTASACAFLGGCAAPVSTQQN